MLQIKKELPPNIDDIRKVLPNVPDTMVFTFGDVLYNPSNNPIDLPLQIHEENHSKQQGSNPRLWWTRFLVDSAFRASQEIPCFQLQFRKAKELIKDRERLNRYLNALAKDLGGEAYGNIMTFQEAREAIKQKEIFDFKV